MDTKNYKLGGFYPYKMDTKGRVSVPSDWRAQIGNGELQLLQSSNEKLPTLRVLTESEFAKMQSEVEESDLSFAQKRAYLGAFFERCTKTHINDQGKLSIPKALLDHPSLVAGEPLVLCGRGGYIEILNESNYKKLCTAREATIENLDEEFGFF